MFWIWITWIQRNDHFLKDYITFFLINLLNLSILDSGKHIRNAKYGIHIRFNPLGELFQNLRAKKLINQNAHKWKLDHFYLVT